MVLFYQRTSIYSVEANRVKSKLLRMTQLFESAHVSILGNYCTFLWTSVDIIDTSSANEAGLGKSHGIDKDRKLTSNFEGNREEMTHPEKVLCGSIDMQREGDGKRSESTKQGDVPMAKNSDRRLTQRPVCGDQPILQLRI
jgi:hypothetical protein